MRAELRVGIPHCGERSFFANAQEMKTLIRLAQPQQHCVRRHLRNHILQIGIHGPGDPVRGRQLVVRHEPNAFDDLFQRASRPGRLRAAHGEAEGAVLFGHMVDQAAAARCSRAQRRKGMGRRSQALAHGRHLDQARWRAGKRLGDLSIHPGVHNPHPVRCPARGKRLATMPCLRGVQPVSTADWFTRVSVG